MLAFAPHNGHSLGMPSGVREETVTFDSERLTEGFYDTASHRSQQVSQHPTVYQKETALPKRRCPRRGKPKYVTEAVGLANQRMLQ